MTSIEERMATLEAEQKHTGEELAELRSDVKKLLEMANRGKGAIALLIAIGGVLGAIATWVGERLLGGP